MFLFVSFCVKLLSTTGLPYLLYHTFANKSRRSLVYHPQLVGGGWGMSLLIFAKQEAKFFYLCFEKSSVTVQKQRTVLFFHCVRIPQYSFFAKQKIHPLGWISCFGGGWGIRTLVPVKANGFQDRLVMTTSIILQVLRPYYNITFIANCQGIF